MHQTLSRVAGHSKLTLEDAQLDWESIAQIACESYERQSAVCLSRALETVLWAASLKTLSKSKKRPKAIRKAGGLLDNPITTQLIGVLTGLHHDVLGETLPASAPLHLMIGGELGLTLAWQFPTLDQRNLLIEHSTQAISQWCQTVTDSVAAIQCANSSPIVFAPIGSTSRK